MSDSEFWDKTRDLDFDYLVILVLKLGTCFGDHYVEAWVVSILTAPKNIFAKSGCNSVSIIRTGVGMQG